MISVQRGNKQLTISEQALPQFLGMGYSKIDKKGNIIQQGEATTFGDLKTENITIKAENENVKAQLIKLQKENESLKSEIEELKKSGEDSAADQKKTKK